MEKIDPNYPNYVKVRPLDPTLDDFISMELIAAVVFARKILHKLTRLTNMSFECDLWPAIQFLRASPMEDPANKALLVFFEQHFNARIDAAFDSATKENEEFDARAKRIKNLKRKQTS